MSYGMVIIISRPC